MRLRVLVVHEDRGRRIEILNILGTAGHQMLLAPNTHDALRLLRQTRDVGAVVASHALAKEDPAFTAALRSEGIPLIRLGTACAEAGEEIILMSHPKWMSVLINKVREVAESKVCDLCDA